MCTEVQKVNDELSLRIEQGIIDVKNELNDKADKEHTHEITDINGLNELVIRCSQNPQLRRGFPEHLFKYIYDRISFTS